MWCNVGLIKLFNRCDARLKQQRSKLVRVAYSWCHQRALADDLVQETLARAMEKCGQLRDPAQLEPWLFAILTNCWRDYLRRLRPRRGPADRGRARQPGRAADAELPALRRCHAVRRHPRAVPVVPGRGVNRGR